MQHIIESRFGFCGSLFYGVMVLEFMVWYVCCMEVMMATQSFICILC
ncbi:hypothetical protein HanRHA438_Chr08g0361351 [Helianthus annuus]|nr:hypothetical protein HanRHA438_Chr08g0361351 [Helianthus annuus]